MASTIQIKRGTGSAVPSGLEDGELAINLDNNKFYFGSGSVSKNSFHLTHITASGGISSSGTITALSMSGDGSGLTNISSTTPAGTVSSSAQITGSSLSLRHITASGNISASGAIITPTITATAGTIGGSSILTEASEISTATVGQTVNTIRRSEDANHFPVFVDSNNSTNTAEQLYTSTNGLSFNPSSQTLNLTSGSIRLIHSSDRIETTNISASGTIIASKIESDNLFNHLGDANTGVQLGADTVTLQGNDVNIGVFSTNRIELNKPVTASSDISSSGNLIGDNVYTDVIRRQSDSSTTTKIKLDDEQIKFFVNDANNQTLQIEDGSVKAIGHITASGNISASGNVFGRQYEQIETNLVSNLGSLSGGYDGDDFIFLPWTDTDTENATHTNKFVQKAVVVPGRPIKTVMRSPTNALGTSPYTMSLWENKTDQGNNNKTLVMEAYADSTGTNREFLTFDWTNPGSGSAADVSVGSVILMGIKSTNGNATYIITHLWEWDYGVL